MTAFQADAFQNDAFQIDQNPPVVTPDVPGRVTLRLGGKNPRV
jgi:hypothetical protein